MKNFEYNRLKIFYRENTADESVLEHSFQNDIFLTSIPYYTPPSDGVIIDIGAHIGTFSFLLAEQMTHGKIFALEPSRETFEVLLKNVISNNFEKRIMPFRIAISNADAQIKLYHDTYSGNWGHSTVSQLSDSYEEVEAFTLDSFFSINNIKHCDLIKFNCEGAEFGVIQNLSDKTLNKINTWIILFHEDLDSTGNRKDIIKKLKKNGFIVRLIRISDDNKRGWITATKSYGRYINFSLKSKLKFIKKKYFKID